MPGSDRQDYWIEELESPLFWSDQNREITHVVLGARWEGAQIHQNVKNLPINIAYTVNLDQIKETSVEFDKSVFIAIGLANEVEGGYKSEPINRILAGRIGKFFGKGNH